MNDSAGSKTACRGAFCHSRQAETSRHPPSPGLQNRSALGWAYTSFLQALVDNPDMSGAELSKSIVNSYIQGDQRINDPQARADYLRQESSDQVSASSLTKELEREVTLTAVDLAGVPDLIKSINTLPYVLQDESQDKIASARTYALAFTNVFGKGKYSHYIDRGGFVQILKRQKGFSTEIIQAADQLLSSLQSAVIAEKHGTGKRGATGISIYFPISNLYISTVSRP